MRNSKMPIQLDVILKDIADEKVLHPNYPTPSKKEVDDAWTRVSKKNLLSVHEARSIFKVLQRKFEQEKSKHSTSWKLFHIMEKIHKKIEPKVEKTDDDQGMATEEDEEYEMLEVQEEEEHPVANNSQRNSATGSGSNSDNESPSKSTRSNESRHSIDKDEEKQLNKSGSYVPKSRNVTSAPASSSNATVISHTEEKKLLNTMASSSPRPPLSQTPNLTVAALNKKGITMKKTMLNSTAGSKAQNPTTCVQVKSAQARLGVLEVGKTIQLPESLKRKLTQDQNTVQPVKKINAAATTSTHNQPTSIPTSSMKTTVVQVSSNQTPTQYVHVKQERDDLTEPQGINVITIPANPTRSDITNGLLSGSGPSSSTAAAVATTTNGYSPRLEDIDYKHDIIFDVGTGVNGASLTKINTTNAPEIINLGNFDNSLPPTFFKNLCNSSRHEALGLYVANVMNRLQERSAAKLELGILRAIIDIQTEDLEQ